MNLVEIKEKLKKDFFETADLILREVKTTDGIFLFAYIDAMIDKVQLEFSIIKSIIDKEGKFKKTVDGFDTVLTGSVKISTEENYDEVLKALSSGDTIIMCDQSDEYFILPIRLYPTRAIGEPPTSAVLKGPREGYTEDIKTNMVLTRRRLRTNKLVFKMFKVGRYTETNIAVCYIEGIVDKDLVKQIEEKIERIDCDGIMDSSYIAKYLESNPYSLFRQTGTAEKPDIICAKMLEGRIAIMVDGSPIVLTLPFFLIEDLQDSQDYYKRDTRVVFLRLIRLTAVFFATLLPAVYCALQQHQFDMLPTKLLITILNSANGIPFSPVVEMLVALILFEILNEASIRMPRYVGMAMSIVGAIVLGDTAVKAGLLSSITVLITALSSIGLYAVPDEVGTFGLLRIIFVIIGGSLGLFGIVLSLLCLICYLTTFQVYGVPYLSPMAPLVPKDLKDSIIKLSLQDMKTRPMSLKNKNVKRQADNEKQ